MKRKIRLALRRTLSVVLMIVMLPLSSMQPAFTAIVHAEGTDEYVAETPASDNGVYSTIGENEDTTNPSEEVVAQDETDDTNVAEGENETTTEEYSNEKPDETSVPTEDVTSEDDTDLSEDTDVTDTEDESENTTMPTEGSEATSEEDAVQTEEDFAQTEEGAEETTVIIDENVDVIEETDYPRLASMPVEIVNLKLEVVINECGNAVLEWNKLEEEGVSYSIYRNGSLIDSVSSEEEGELISYIDSKITGGTEFTYKVTGTVSEVLYGISDECTVKTPDVLEINSDYTLTSDMTVFEIKHHKGYIYLNGYELKVCKNYIADGYYAVLYLNGGSFKCYGDLIMNHYNAYINMNNAQDYLYVKGNAYFNKSKNAYLGNGIFEIEGNIFAQNLYSENYNKVILSGSEKQLIDVSFNSYFRYLINNNISEEGVYFARPTQIFEYEYYDANRVFICDEEAGKGFTLFEDTFIDGDYSIGYGVLDLNGYTLTINGDFIHEGGDVVVGEGKLIVKGDYRIENETVNEKGDILKSESAGRLRMNNDTGMVLVEGDFITYSIASHNELLTAGTIELKGDFTQISGSVENFRATENHTVLLSGDGKQTVKFTDSQSDKSFFNNLEIQNESEEGVVFDTTSSYPLAIGKVNDNGNKIKGALSIIYSTSFEDNHYCSDIAVTEGTFIDNDIEIDGNFSVVNHDYFGVCGKMMVGGELRIEAGYFYISSAIYTKGNIYFIGSSENNEYYLNEGSITTDKDLIIKSNAPSSETKIFGNYYDEDVYVTVKGNMFVEDDCYYMLERGILTLGGNLSGNGYIQLSGTHKTIFNGTEIQEVDINKGSYFASVEIDNSSEEGVVCLYLYPISNLNRKGNNITFEGINGLFGWKLEEDTTIDGDLVLIDDTLDLNGHKLIITGNLIQYSGIVYVHGGELVVDGDYRSQKEEVVDGNKQYVSGSGMLKMVNPYDKVLVKGNYINQSVVGSEGLLTEGILEVKGDFYQISGSSGNFIATDNHTVLLSGENKQTVKFTDSRSDQSFFNNLEIKNESEEGVVFDTTSSYPLAKGKVKDNGNKATGELAIAESTSFEQNHYCSDIVVAEMLSINNDIETDGNFTALNYNHVFIYGNLTVGGELSLKTYATYVYSDIYAKGNIYIGGSEGYEYFRQYGGSITTDSDLIIQRGEETEFVKIENYTYYNNYDENNNQEFPVTVKGNMFLDDKCYYSMDRGILSLGGNLSGNGFVQLSGTHKTILNGTGSQIIDINSKSFFNTLEVNNTSEEGIIFKFLYPIKNLISNNKKITYDGIDGVLGWKLEEDTLIEGDLVLIDDTLDLNGHKLTIKGNLLQYSGVVFVHGGELVVDGDYRIEKVNNTEGNTVYETVNGMLKMVNPNDYVLVKGSFVNRSIASYDELLTNGALEIKGDFYQISGSTSNFTATENHTVILSGNRKQTVKFNDSLSYNSYFNNLEIKNESEEGVVFDTTSSYPLAKGKVKDNGNKVTGELAIAESTSFEENHYCSDIIIVESMDINTDIETDGNFTAINNRYLDIYGNLIIGRDLRVQNYSTYVYSDIYVKGNIFIAESKERYMYFHQNGGSITTDRDLIIQRSVSTSEIRINNNSDQDTPITVKGNMSIGDGCSCEFYNGQLTLAGNLNVNGRLQLNENHKTIFNGTGLQLIELNETSYFANLELQNYSKEGISFNRMIKYDSFTRNGCKVSFGNYSYEFGWTLVENEVYDADFYLGEDTLDLNGNTLTVNGDFIAMGGKVDFNGGKLVVNGDLRVQIEDLDSEGNVSYGPGSCRFIMDGPDDYLLINGGFYYYPQSSLNIFSDGIIEIKGDFIQYGNKAFIATDKNIVKFTGDTTQIIENNYYCSPQFSNFIDENSEELFIKSIIYITDSFTDSTENINGNGKIIISNPSIVENGICSGNLEIRDGFTLQEDLSVKGNLTVYGTVHANGKSINTGNLTLYSDLYVEKSQITVSNDIKVYGSGRIIMINDEDYVLSNGNFYFGSDYNHSDYLTAGILEVRGDFTQSNYRNFIASGTHTTILSKKKNTAGREYIQTIYFSDTYESRFNKVILKKQEKDYHFLQPISSISNEVVYEIDDEEAPSAVAYIVDSEITEKSVTIGFGGAEDNNGILGYEVYRDGKLLGVTSNTTYTDYLVDSDKQYTYTVFAFDDERNKATTSPALNIRTKKDLETPTIPQNLGLRTRTGSSITIEWSPSTDNVKVDGYNIYANGELLEESVKTTYYKAYNLKRTQAYSFSVEAVDKAGNVSDRSTEIEAEVKMPKIVSVSPSDNQGIGGEYIVLNVYFENVGNSLGNKVAIQIKNDEDEWETIVNNLSQKVASYGRLYTNYTWDISELTGEDSYELRYILTDADGNEDIQEVTYVIDKEGPEVPSNFKAVSNNGNVNISFDASSSADCTGYEIHRASYGEDLLLCKLNGRYETIYTDKDVKIGASYEYYIYAYDKCGNKSNVSERIVTLIEEDKVAPEIKEFNPRAGRVNSEVKFEINAKDNKSVAAIGLQYKAVNADEWIDIEEKNASNDKAAFTFNTTTLEDGEYFFNAYAIDKSGNKSTELFTRRYDVDNTGIGKIVITEVSSGSSFVRIEWEDVTEEDFGYFAVEQLNNGNFERVGKEAEMLGYYVKNLKPDNDYTFRVVGYDDLGNRGIESEEINVRTTEDNINPTISAVYPESSYYSNVIKLAMDAKDDNELDYAIFSYSLDGTDFEELSTIKAEAGKKENRFSTDFDISEIREGQVYIKFEVFDVSGNKNILDTDGNDLIVEYRVDRTAPSKVTNLQCKANEGFVEIAWDNPAEEEKDVKGFKIWRADNSNGIYTLIKDNCSTLNYYDNSVKVGSMYLYKVAAIDLAGNVGELSDEIIVTVNKDFIAPIVLGISPNTNSKICANQTFSVATRDNAAVSSVRLEYTQEGERNFWSTIGKASEKSNYCVSQITWDTEKIEEGEYYIRAIATDAFGNESEACLFTYVLDKTPIKVSDIKTETGHFEIVINVSLEDDSDYSYMEVLRREVGGSFKNIAKTKDLSYVDSDIIANKNYFYKVKIYDEAGNVSLSEEVGGYADDKDVIAPIASLPENYIGIAGMELGLDGLASHDNVRITEYTWDMGNGDVIKGATPRYTYNKAGNYTVILTVKDASGNKSSTSTTARIYDKTGKGKTKVQVVDEGGMGIPYALVYLKLDENNGLPLKTDKLGYVEIVQDVGVARIAAYKQDYLPSEMEILVSEYEVKEYKLRLVKNELIVGKLTVHRMSLEEMQQAGVVFGGANNHVYTFTVELVYQQKAYELSTSWSGFGWTGSGGGLGGHGGSGADFGNPTGPGGSSGSGGKVNAQVVDVVDEKPILVTVSKTDSISWLKDMFQVDLVVVNMADYQFAIENSTATIEYPDGVSLADLAKGQSRTQDLGTIHGQETKTASWVLRGDKSGDYEVSADFNGILMPFEAPVSAHFVADSSISVSTGEGIHITIMPESTVDCGGQLYIQYAIENNSGRPLYNFQTTIGAYQEPDHVFTVTDVDTGREFKAVSRPNGEVEVLQNDFEESDNSETSENSSSKSGKVEMGVKDTSATGQTYVSMGSMPMTFDTLYPGQVFYGTYVHTMPAAVKDSEDDKKEYYFELVEAMAKCIQGEDLGVTLSISPIGGHYHREIYGSPENYYGAPPTIGDPVDITSGYYKDEVTVMSLNGGQEFTYDLSYSSGTNEKSGEIGYGWNSQYEMRLEQRNGIVWLYTSPDGIASFVKSDAMDNKYYGKVIGSKIILDDSKDFSIGEYKGITPGLEGFKLVRNQDLSYTLYYPGGAVKNFYSDGRLSKVISAEKQTLSLSYDGNNTVITEDISGKTFTAVHDANGLVTEVRDSAGRVSYLSYDGNSNLIAIVRPDGTTLRYAYDENHRITQALNANGTFVTNEYDANNRVVNQKDAFGNTMIMSYEDYANYSKKVTIVHANGATQTINVNSKNAITSETTANNATAVYSYDSNGNLIAEKDSENNTVYREYDQNNYIIKATDKGGIVTTFTYDSRGNVISVLGSDGSSSSYSYDSNNHLVSFTDAMGLRTDYTYDSNGLMTSETKGDLGTITYGYTNGLITSITDSLGNISRIEYDACGNVVKTTDAKGNITKYTYNSVGKMLSETDAFGNTSYYTYDCNGNCISVKDSLGNVYKCEYDAMSRLVKETFADGSIVSYEYDNVGNLIKKSFPGGVTETYSYDLCNNLTKVSSSDGSSITYTYDSLGQKTSETDEFGRSVKFEYYPNGSIYKTVFADGSNVIYTYNQRWKCTTKAFSERSSEYTSYDKNGNVTSITDAMGNIVKFEYDKYNRLIKETDAKGYETKYIYDAKGNCVSKTDAAGRTAHMVYDAVGQLIEAYVLDSKGEKYSVKYEYDALGRVIATTDEEGYTTKVKYDALGNVKSTIDANGNETDITTYDSVGRVTSVKGTDGSVTNYSYDARGNVLTAITNLSGINKSSKYTYDEKGRVVSVKENDALTTKVSYDSYGNVASVTDANGGTTKYQYDNLSRLTAVISSLGNKETYTYNAQGLMAELTNARGQKTSYTYDLLGRVTSMTDELGKVNYTYDANGNLIKVEDSKGIIKRTYDSLDRVTSYTDYNGNTIKYSYDELGNLLSITYPGGEVVRYEYYKNGWLKRVVDNNGKVTSYTYNALGQVATCTRPNNTKEIRSYDPKTSRLLVQREIRNDSNGAFVEEISNYVYTYNASGNIESVEGFDNESEGLKTASFKYDSANRLIEYNGKEVKYDADGNMVYGPVDGVMTDLSYDCRNRLIYAGGVRYEYDAENTRIAEETSDYRAVFVTDVNSAELSKVLVKKTYKKTNGVVSTNSIDRLYVYGYGLISETEGASTLYHHYNNIGSTMKLSDGLGNIVAEYTYGPYGELLSGNKLTDYLYNGQYGVSTDDNGLYYMRQRYYNSEIKRFINQDILTGEVGHSQSMNRYAYVEGNPINLMDPFGLSPEEANGKSIWSMLIHGGLGVVGCIPGVFGVVANLLDAALYFYEKDYFMATISLLSAASLGTATVAMKAFGATCAGIKVAKGAMLAYRAIDLVGNGVNFVRNAYAFGGQANNIATKAYKGEKITGKDVGGLFLTGLGTFLSGLGTFASVKGLGKAADEFADSLNYACFVAGTEIDTIEGEKNIEDIEEGDYVLAEDPETGEQEYKPVVRTFINEKDVLMHIFVEDEEIVCTPEHPFYVEGIGFVLAKDLQEGNILRTSDKQNPQVTKVEKEYLDEPIKVYNLEVEDFHTYFVSEKSILVHNECRPTWKQSELDAKKNYPDYESQKSFMWSSEKNEVIDVDYGTKGSVRPDYYKNGYSVDVKNYNIETSRGRNSLTYNIQKQYFQRLKNLPLGTKQSVLIDIRGQKYTNEMLFSLSDRIMEKTNDGIEIIFKTN